MRTPHLLRWTTWTVGAVLVGDLAWADDALFIDERGTVKVQGLDAAGTVRAQRLEGDGSSLLLRRKDGAGDETMKDALDRKLDKADGVLAREANASDEIQTERKEWVDVPGMTIDFSVTAKRRLYIHFVVSEAWASREYAHYRLMLDATEIGSATMHNVSRHSSVVILRAPEVEAGPHIVKAQWRSPVGTARSMKSRTLVVMEL